MVVETKLFGFLSMFQTSLWYKSIHPIHSDNKCSIPNSSLTTQPHQYLARSDLGNFHLRIFGCVNALLGLQRILRLIGTRHGKTDNIVILGVLQSQPCGIKWKVLQEGCMWKSVVDCLVSFCSWKHPKLLSEYVAPENQQCMFDIDTEQMSHQQPATVMMTCSFAVA